MTLCKITDYSLTSIKQGLKLSSHMGNNKVVNELFRLELKRYLHAPWCFWLRVPGSGFVLSLKTIRNCICCLNKTFVLILPQTRTVLVTISLDTATTVIVVSTIHIVAVTVNIVTTTILVCLYSQKVWGNKVVFSVAIYLPRNIARTSERLLVTSDPGATGKFSGIPLKI